ncbi:hypothetical protein RJ640_024362 [Escallonia rubra]|uniref:WAT1-related protein n=1 Tax=Escallonia rubra TaxID=112253 RepID=A0AA88RQ97_9ASTE|nr:hypothetical protein RJ640_024362 [Escallonia rubra]
MEMGMQSCIQDSLPFAAMVIVECGEIVMITLGKAAMNSGMSNLVYVVYYNTLGTLMLLPFFVIHTHRYQLQLSNSSSCHGQLDSSIYILACHHFQVGPTLRMEKLNLRRSPSQAKSMGTILAILGAFVMTLYKGPPVRIFMHLNSPNQLVLLQQSNWALGGIFLAITCVCSAAWSIFQTATVKEYPDQMTVIFFFCCFGTIQCAILTLIVERNPGAWVLHPGIETIAVVFAAIFASVFRIRVITWCLCKKGPVYVAMFKPIQMVIAAITGTIFLGDTLHLGSVIGAVIIALGFYTVMWGKAKEKNTEADTVCGLESSTENTPLLAK